MTNLASQPNDHLMPSDAKIDQIRRDLQLRAYLAIAVAIVVMFAGAFLLVELAVPKNPQQHQNTAQTNMTENSVDPVAPSQLDGPMQNIGLTHENSEKSKDVAPLPDAKALMGAQSVQTGDNSTTSSPVQIGSGAFAQATRPKNYFGPSIAPHRLTKKESTAPIALAQTAPFIPRLKPSHWSKSTLAVVKTSASATHSNSRIPVVEQPITFDSFAFANPDDRPVPFYFNIDKFTNHGNAPTVPISVALSQDIKSPPTTLSVKIVRGETFVDTLKRAGVKAEDRNAAALEFGKVQNLRQLQPGQEFEITTSRPNITLFQMASNEAKSASHLISLKYKIDSTKNIRLSRNEDDSFKATTQELAVTTKLATVRGRIDGSLFLSAKKAGAPNKVIGNFANMFAYDVDFQRDIFGGDEFEVIFEILYDDQGNIVGSGDILYGRLKWRGRSKEKGYFRFEDTKKDKADFFDRSGQSAKRLLMKTPIDGARLSSGFGTRRHPILGYRKAHKGVDFAARRGTPVYAAGDGVIERANRFSSFGNYVRIRHSNGYKTAYAHLKGFRKGIRKGKRVNQGDVIAYVGTTGRSTGPHLHYEVHHKGKAVNPQKLKIATGVQLKSTNLANFKIQRDTIEKMRLPPDPSPDLLADDTAKRNKSL